MQIGPMKEVLLTSAKDAYLFNCRVAGQDPQTLSEYRDVLGSFIHFTGDRLVGELTPDHVRVYMDTLDDCPDKGTEHIRLVMDHYVVIHTWIRWLFAQKFITERYSNTVKPP